MLGIHILKKWMVLMYCEQAHFGGDNTDAFYIPAHLASDFQVAAAAFAQKNMLAEIAIPAILGMITEGPQEFEVISNLQCTPLAKSSTILCLRSHPYQPLSIFFFLSTQYNL
jgi:hypothetical protein